MRTFWLSLVLGIGAAGMAQADSDCRVQAKNDFKVCRQQCKDGLRDAKFECLGIDPACGRACLGGREVCLEPIDLHLDNCTDVCKATLKDKRDNVCPAQCETDPDPACLDSCIDDAQVVAFTCRDDCRESFRVNFADDIRLCKDAFEACVGLCPKL